MREFMTEEKNTFGYQWVRKSTGEFYRGIHTGDPDDNYAGSGVVFTSKFGGRRKSDCNNPDDWVRSILFIGTHQECLVWESLVVTERELQRAECLNKALGGYSGSAGTVVSDATRAKMSKAQTGRKHTEESKKKMSESWKSREPVSQETKDKISATLTGRKLSEETKQKLSKSGKGRVISEQGRRNMAKAKIGHAVSDETKQKISESKKLYWARRKEAAMEREVDV